MSTGSRHGRCDGRCGDGGGPVGGPGRWPLRRRRQDGAQVADRFLAKGPDGFVGRSSRPPCSQSGTSEATRPEVIRLRCAHPLGVAWIAHRVAWVPRRCRTSSTRRAWAPDRGDRAAGALRARTPWGSDSCGHLETARYSPAGGWRVQGRGRAPTPGGKAGYRTGYRADYRNGTSWATR